MIGGNYVCQEVLPYVKFEQIRKTPKVVMGHSDITSLLLAIHRRTGLVVFYGPSVLSSLGEFPDVLSFTRDNLVRALFETRAVGEMAAASSWTDEFLDWMTGEDSVRPRSLRPSAGWQWLQPGKAQGRLIGGCLQVMADMVRRNIDEIPATAGAVFFWESAEKNVRDPIEVEAVAGDIATLKDAGILKHIGGMVVGRPYGYTTRMCAELGAALCEVLDNPRIPVLFNADFGHTDPMLVLPIGTESTLDSFASRWAIDEPALTERGLLAGRSL